jgi:hypothetical protein
MDVSTIQLELPDLKSKLAKLEKDITSLNISMEEAEKHVLNEDKINFWIPKLDELRKEKHHLFCKEEQLRDQILIREKFLLSHGTATNEAPPTQPTSFVVNSPPEMRERSGTWSHAPAFLTNQHQDDSRKMTPQLDQIPEDTSMKKSNSSPSILTKLTNQEIINTDEDAVLQGLHRRRHIGNFGIHKPTNNNTVVDDKKDFNVFGIAPDEDEDLDEKSIVPEKVDSLSSSKGKDTTHHAKGGYNNNSQPSISGILSSIAHSAIDSFVAMEDLVVYQVSDLPDSDTSTKELDTSEDNSNAPVITSNSATMTTANHRLLVRDEKRPIMMNPVQSAHDFSVFGVDLNEDD